MLYNLKNKPYPNDLNPIFKHSNLSWYFSGLLTKTFVTNENIIKFITELLNNNDNISNNYDNPMAQQAYIYRTILNMELNKMLNPDQANSFYNLNNVNNLYKLSNTPYTLTDFDFCIKQIANLEEEQIKKIAELTPASDKNNSIIKNKSDKTNSKINTRSDKNNSKINTRSNRSNFNKYR